MSGFSNQPKILRGAFVEYGISIPPLILVFQFNPVDISRKRSNSFSVPDMSQDKKEGEKKGGGLSLREFHQHKEFEKLEKLRDAQDVSVEPETISIEIRFDATDKLNEGDTITEQFGIAPELSTLELMMYPKSESLLGAAVSAIFGGEKVGYTFTGSERPPMILFIWGRKKVLPVNLNSMSIKEEEFSTDLNPIRATVSVDMTVIEGPNPPYLYSKVMKEAMSVLNLANLLEIVNVIVPL